MRTAIALLVLVSLSSLATADDIAEAPRERRLAVGTDPTGLLAGRYALSATYVVSRRAAIRGDIEIRDGEAAGSFNASGGWSAAISVPIFLDRPLHGPFIEPGLAYAQRLVAYGFGSLGGVSGGALGGLSDTMAPSAYAIYERSLEPQIFVGWQWMFGSGLHIAGAIGVSRHFTTDGSGTSYPIPESYLRVGIAL
jgi:hypothetical protein